MGRSGRFAALLLWLSVPCASVAQAATETVVHSFGNGDDGANPVAGVINVNGTLYGTTSAGGTKGHGTVFALDPVSGAETVLHSFKSGQDGASPAAGLTEANHVLFGTTARGGANRGGTVFSIDPSTWAETVVYAFCARSNCADGKSPEAALTRVTGTLYGTTSEGGVSNAGTVFALDPKTGTEKVIYSFCNQQNCADGRYPYAGVIDLKGALYGTTYGAGGTCECGTVFGVNATTGAETTLFAFDQSDGANSMASVIAAGGKLYGTAALGGKGGSDCHGLGCGTVFSVDPATNAVTVVHFFGQGSDGVWPYAGLINVDGTLYGTTYIGGAGGAGAVFALKMKTGKEIVLYSFCSSQNCTDGEWPSAGMIDANGTFYGTTAIGGAYGGGTVFAITP